MANKVVKTKSKGYNYNYASLSDLAKQDVAIPKMRIKLIDGNEYVEYYDEELKEWQLGARVLPIEMKGSSACQSYGASITYARRFTTQLACSVACDDDKEVETKDNKVQKATQTQIDIISKSNKLVVNELKGLGIEKPSQLKNLSQTDASKLCLLIKERKAQWTR